jgi:hypothetical protein
LRKLDYNLGEAAIATALRFTLSTGIHIANVGTTNPANLRAIADILSRNKHLDACTYAAIRERWNSVASPDWVGLT